MRENWEVLTREAFEEMLIRVKIITLEGMNPEDRELDLPSGIEGKKILVRDALELIRFAKDLGKMGKLREVSFLLDILDIASDILEELMDKYGISLKEILEILKEDDKEEIAYALVTAGSIHYKRGEYEKALEFYKEALKIREEIDKKRKPTLPPPKEEAEITILALMRIRKIERYY